MNNCLCFHKFSLLKHEQKKHKGVKFDSYLWRKKKIVVVCNQESPSKPEAKYRWNTTFLNTA